MADTGLFKNIKKSESQMMLGVKVGGVRIDTILGEGPRALVFKGLQIPLKRTVALKILKESSAANEKQSNDFLEAGRHASILIHPNIVPVYDVIDSDGYKMIVMKLIESPTLDDVLARGLPLDATAIIHVAGEACAALAYAYNQGRLHGNICPQSMFIDNNANILISDFCHPPYASGSPLTADRMMERGLYQSPEAIRGEQPSMSSDLFSLGVALYHSATGGLPFSPNELNACAFGGDDLPHPDAKKINPGVPSGISDFLAWLLRADYRQRPASYDEAVDAMRIVAKEFGDQAGASAIRKALVALNDTIGPDKRKYRRLRANMDVKIKQRNTSEGSAVMLLEKLHNISENGAFITTGTPLPIGSFVSIEFDIKGQQTQVGVLGVVRWLSEKTPGMGVQFIEVSTSDRRNLKDFVSESMANDMKDSLLQTQMHKTILKLYLFSVGQTLSFKKLLGATGASKMLLKRTLDDFDNFGLITVENDEIICNKPEDQRIMDVLRELARRADRPS